MALIWVSSPLITFAHTGSPVALYLNKKESPLFSKFKVVLPKLTSSLVKLPAT